MIITIRETLQTIETVKSELSNFIYFHSLESTLPEESVIELDKRYSRIIYQAEDLFWDMEGLWQHYKRNDLYLYLGFAIDVDNPHLSVLYTSPNNLKTIWSRPLTDFLGKVESEISDIYPNQKETKKTIKVKRFTRISVD